MSPHVYETSEYDKSPEKQRRMDYVSQAMERCDSMTATNYPTQMGALGVNLLAKRHPNKKFVLADKVPFHKGWLSASNIIQLPKTDIYTAIQLYPAEFLDIDPWGGLPLYGKLAIERAEKWIVLLLTCARVYRGRTENTGAVPKGQNLEAFMQEWCEMNAWEFTLLDTYKRPNKNERVGKIDGRGPRYLTYVIARTRR